MSQSDIELPRRNSRESKYDTPSVSEEERCEHCGGPSGGPSGNPGVTNGVDDNGDVVIFINNGELDRGELDRGELDRGELDRGVDNGVDHGTVRGRDRGVDHDTVRGRDRGVDHDTVRGRDRGVDHDRERGRDRGHIPISPRKQDHREKNIIITSKSISHKKFHDWKKDEAHDNTTCNIIQVQGVRLNSKERCFVLDSLMTTSNEDEFCYKIRNVKGVFLLDQDILEMVIEKYEEKIFKIIEQLNYKYHLCYLSETIHKMIYRKKSSMAKLRRAIDDPLSAMKIFILLASIVNLVMVAVALYYKIK